MVREEEMNVKRYSRQLALHINWGIFANINVMPQETYLGKIDMNTECEEKPFDKQREIISFGDEVGDKKDRFNIW
jgi:hypothetical protein